MAISLKLDTDFTGSDLPPVAWPDPIMTAGTRTLFDFTNADCNANADGVLTTSAVFTDLVAGQPAAGITAGSLGTAHVTSRTGRSGLSWDVIAGQSQMDSVSLPGQRWQATEALTFWLWFLQASDGSTTSYQPWLFRYASKTGPTANNSQVWLDSGSSGNNPRGQLLASGGAAGTGPNPAAGTALLTRGVAHMMALVFVPSSTLTLYHDGVQVAQSTSGVPASLADNSAWITCLQLTGKGVIYRFGVEAAAAAGRSGAACVAAEYALKAGSFS